MVFELPVGFADTLYHQQEERCAVTGISFNLEYYADALVKFPFAPSIDRRLSTDGYREKNVRLVCVAANFGMGQWGEEVLLTLARAAVDYERQRKVAGEAEWRAGLEDRLAAAEKLLSVLPDREREKQRHHIAGLKSALIKGLAGVRSAAEKAKSAAQAGYS
jgi:hypothetical protein